MSCSGLTNLERYVHIGLNNVLVLMQRTFHTLLQLKKFVFLKSVILHQFHFDCQSFLIFPSFSFTLLRPTNFTAVRLPWWAPV
jgi:hypothetical protein